MKYNSLLQETTTAREQVEAIIKTCPECTRIPYLEHFLNKKKKSMEDLIIMRHSIDTATSNKDKQAKEAK